jgi:hypothetical protein
VIETSLSTKRNNFRNAQKKILSKTKTQEKGNFLANPYGTYIYYIHSRFELIEENTPIQLLQNTNMKLNNKMMKGGRNNNNNNNNNFFVVDVNVDVVSVTMMLLLLSSYLSSSLPGVMANVNITFACWSTAVNVSCNLRTFGEIGGEIVMMDSVSIIFYYYYYYYYLLLYKTYNDDDDVINMSILYHDDFSYYYLLY